MIWTDYSRYYNYIVQIGNNISTSFFSVMVHLAVHLPYEMKVIGSISYSLMYLIERNVRPQKQYVRNKAHLEGSIVEGYLMNESRLSIDGI